ncbi:helix-turn-helix transcriptional regulator [Halorientalis brevis]|uniref:Helix-turn-helix transcriptional regulator n=1 Tax=Halorientalis brevis TaxID=1126241 RepID=A0ABD6C6F3_9EURY|nr:transcriptional regulator FilR1 domain-containing protein [Halorientalis brevis]
MSDSLAEIEFLAGSPYRIEVLQALTDDAYTRRELGDAVDASQPTIGRVLRDLAERHWIAYDGERYRATATGELVEAGITDLQDRLETETRLRDVIPWLPTEAMDVSLQAFSDATITTPSGTRPNAPIQRMVELLEEADTALLLSHSFNRHKLDLLSERVTDGTLTAKGVFSADAIDAIVETPELSQRLREINDAAGASIRVASEEVPLAMEVTDDRTHLLLRDEEGLVRASIDTDDERVRAWAADVHERYWERATPIDSAEIG